MKKSVLYLVTESSYFCSHRLSLARAAKKAGFDVMIATNIRDRLQFLENEGFKVINIPFKRGQLNLLAEFIVFLKILLVYYKYKPDILHHIALKPVIYGSVANLLRFNKSQVINMLGGLGYIFTSTSFKANIIRPLVKLGLKLAHLGSSTKLILQNQDDVAELSKLLPADKLSLIPGSGVNTTLLQPQSMPDTKTVRATLVGRMLWTKGIGELVEAQKLLKKDNISIDIDLVGDIDPENPANIDREILQAWHNQNLVNWHGSQSNIAKLYEQSDIAVLPSYREGLPKSLLEAASLGKPIITTNAPGCRDVIEDGISGILVPPKDPKSLANAIKQLVFSKELRQSMGNKARDRAIAIFDEEKINGITLQLYTADIK